MGDAHKHTTSVRRLKNILDRVTKIVQAYQTLGDCTQQQQLTHAQHAQHIHYVPLPGRLYSNRELLKTVKRSWWFAVVFSVCTSSLGYV